MNTLELRVWNVINPPAEPRYYYVGSVAHAKLLIDRMADEQLQKPHIWGNAFGLEAFDGDEWAEWYSEDGEDINDWGGEDVS